MSKYTKSPLALNYINIRKWVGILAMSIPIVIFLAEKVFFQTELQPSISAYYYTDMRWFFGLALCGIGFFLLFYQGYDKWDTWLAKLAGFAAFLTAFFPTSNPNSSACESPLFAFSPSASSNDAIYKSICSITADIHLGSALTMFVIVMFFSLCLFKKGEIENNQKVKRNTVYAICGEIIFAAILVMIFFSLAEFAREKKLDQFGEIITSWGRFVALILLFVGIVVALWRDLSASKNEKNHIHNISKGFIIVGAILAILLFFLGIRLGERTIFWGEFVALLAFGVSWAVKGEMLWLKDKERSATSKVFNELQSRQVDGYKSGLGIFVFLIAIWLTILLYSSQIAPFNLFVEEKGAESEKAAGVVTTTLPGDDTGAEVPKIQILNPEVLGNLCYPSNEDNQTKAENAEDADNSTCVYYNKDKGRIVVPLAIANISDVDINLNFDVLYMDNKPCKVNPNECVFIVQAPAEDLNNQDDQDPDENAANQEQEVPIEALSNEKSIPISKNTYKVIVFSFSSEEISGQLSIIGGNSITIIPFSVAKEKLVSEYELPPAGETRTLGFYKTEAREILMGILFLLVVVVFYFILNNQVLSLFWPLVRRNFRVDLGDDEAEKKENGQLWTLFSNQVNELGLRPGFSVNPRAESSISAPSTLTPDSSYLKTFFDLVNWIFPRIGYSMRMTKMSSKELGAGLSLAVAKNDRKENIAEKTFWASHYGIMRTDNESDLNVYRLLMIPAYFWYEDIVDRMDGFEPNEHAWVSKANYHLGNSLWHSNVEKGINYYTNCINLDPENWPAFAALGRVWLEISQDEKVKDFSEEYLLLANNYLNTAIGGLRKTKSIDEVYFGALYNQIVVLLYLLEKNIGKKERVLLKGNMVKKESLATLKLIKNSLTNGKPNIDISHDSLWDWPWPTKKDVPENIRAIIVNNNLIKTFEDVLNSENIKKIEIACELLDGQNGLCDKEIDNVNENLDTITEQKLKNHLMATWLIDYLQALEFVMQIIRLKEITISNSHTHLSTNVIPVFNALPCCKKPIDMDHSLTQKNKWHFARSHYRVQFNAACFYSVLASKTKDKVDKKDIINIALDHLEMALGVGGGLVEFAKKDSQLKAIREDKRFKILTEKDSPKQKEMEESKLHIHHYMGKTRKRNYKGNKK